MENNNNNSHDPDDFSDSDDLLHSLTYSIRKFHLGNSWENVLAGVILEETEDSFLVALPIQLLRVEDHLFIKPVDTGDEPFLRLLKSSVMIVSSLVDQSERLYVDYVTKTAPAEFPELLEMLNIEGADGLNELVITDEMLREPPVEKRTDTSLRDAVLVNASNTTNEDIDSKVKKAIKEGSFIPNTSKLAN